MPKAIDDLYNTILRESRPILISHGYEQLTIRNVARICGVGGLRSFLTFAIAYNYSTKRRVAQKSESEK